MRQVQVSKIKVSFKIDGFKFNFDDISQVPCLVD